MPSFSVSQNPYARAFFSFGAIQITQLALPLLAFPWLGRILGRDAFGLLMYMCLVPPVITLFMDWGLPLGAARAAARCREQPQRQASLLSAVFSAKIILAGACLAGSLAAWPILPHALEWPGGYFLAVALGLVRGISPLWFFQGMGRGMRRMAVWDVASSVSALALVFLCVRSPAQWPNYLFFTALCKGLAYLWLCGGLWRRHAPGLDFHAGLAILGQTKTLFASSFFTVVYTNGAQILLGYFLSASQMGIIVAVSKMARAMVSLINPISQTFFPEICVLREQKPARTRRILCWSLLAVAALSLLGTALVWLLAPWLIRLALGAEFASGASVLRIMVLAVPLMACGQALGTQALVAFGREKAQMSVQAIVAIAALPLAAMLGHFGGITGGATLPVCVEGAILAGYLVMLAHYGAGSFHLGRKT